MSAIGPRTPVIIGIGRAQQREEDFHNAKEPLDLMIAAARQAESDAGAAGKVLSQVGSIYVPLGRWSYRNPGRAIAQAIGAAGATSVMIDVGVLQQKAIGLACSSIVSGEVDATMVVGGDAGYRLLRAAIAGEQAVDVQQDDDPDVFLRPATEIAHPIEVAAGLTQAVAYYAIMDSAFRAAQGRSIAQHRDILANLYSGFSRIAQYNPFAWTRQEVAPDFIRDSSPKNPMQAFPYTKLHCSSWNVDQASAILFCAAETAEALGIDRAKWIFPLASTESNHMVAMSARPQLDRVPGAELAGKAALEVGGITPEQIDFLELYSCFPVAVEAYAREIGIDLARRGATVTGGMTFAGGPYNNYVFDSTCRIIDQLRANPGSKGFVSSVSGLLTKQGFGIYSSSPGPAEFASVDVTAQVKAQAQPKALVDDFTGDGEIRGYTVVYDKGKPPQGIAVIDIDESRRTVAATQDEAIIGEMESGELVGRKIKVARLKFATA